MKRAKDVIGLSIILFENGEEIEAVEDILFNKDKKRVIGFLIDEGGWFKGAKILLLKNAHSIGKDAIIIKNKDYIMSSTNIPEVEKILEGQYNLFDIEVMDDKGDIIGRVDDIIFNGKTGEIEYLEVSEGVIDDIIYGRLKLPISDKVFLEQKRVIVDSEHMKKIDKTGGLKKYFSDNEKGGD